MGASAAFPTTRNTVGFAAGHLFGMGMSNNAGDATNDIDFAAGQCRDSTDVKNLIGGALTKQLDATWAAGTNAGGKMSAAAIANTTYFCFAILKDSDGSVDYGFDTSPTAPTMPTGYTYFRRIGAILREGGAIVGFVQTGDVFYRKVASPDIAANNPGTSAVLAVLKVPVGLIVGAIATVTVYDATPAAAANLLVTSPGITDSAATTIWSMFVPAAGAGVPSQNSDTLEIITDTSAQVRYRLSASTTDHTVYINTHGWRDTRGRLA